MIHDAGCEGAHTAEVTCAKVAYIRAQIQADPWYCQGDTPHGYHGFVSEYPADDEVCRFDGCDRTWGDLQARIKQRGSKV